MGQYEILKLHRRTGEDQPFSNLLVLECRRVIREKPLQPVWFKSSDPGGGFTLQNKQKGMRPEQVLLIEITGSRLWLFGVQVQ